MNEINELLGIEDEEDYHVQFNRIWRLAITGLNCQRPPQVNIPEGIILTSAFDLRDNVGEAQKKEESLSFLRIAPPKDDVISEETTHMEIMSTSFNKKKPDALRTNRCSILITNEKLSHIVNSDPQNRTLMNDFLFKETPNSIKKSIFSDATGIHWEGHYNKTTTLDVLNIKKILVKCSEIILHEDLA